MLVRLLYVSRSANQETDPAESILAACRKHNPENGITGVLCHGKGIYLQMVEGGRDEVNAMYARILADKRHKDVVLLAYEEINERRFGCWMGLVNLAKINASTILKYSISTELDPYKVPGRVSLALIDELMATAAVRGMPDD